MTPRFVFHPAAGADLREARDWYEAQQPGLGQQLGQIVAEALDRVAAAPAQYPAVLPGVRRIVLTRFPYSIFYRERSRDLQVLAIWHHRRDPTVWQGRAAI